MTILILTTVTAVGGGSLLIQFSAKKAGLVDVPQERSSHTRPTPKGGGIGILAAFLFACLWTGYSAWFWAPTAAVALLSFYGDRKHLSPLLRLAAHFGAAAAILWWWAQSTPLIPDAANWTVLLPICLLAAVYVVGTANFYNFMDGINGLAAVTGTIAFGGLWLFIQTHAEIRQAHPNLASVCLAMSVGCLAFLPFNLPHARVFLGDVGSVFLGFVFAVCCLLTARTLNEWLCLSMLIFPFYADELSTMALRLRRGENLLLAHRRHLYQILVHQRGHKHLSVTLGYALLQLVIGALFLLLLSSNWQMSLTTALLCLGVFHWVNVMLHRRWE